MTDTTQKQKILAYLKRHHYVTRMDAFRHCGCCNLWARIATPERVAEIEKARGLR